MSYARNLARLARDGSLICDTAQALRDSVIYDGIYPPSAVTLGVLSAGDGGGGLWRWDAASTATDDTGAALQLTGHVGAGRYRRVCDDNTVNIRWFGALGVNGVDYTAEIDAANAFLHTLGGGTLWVPIGTYGYTGTLTMWDVQQHGSGRYSLVGEHPGRVLQGAAYDGDKGHCSWLDITPSNGPAVAFIGANDPLKSRGGAIRIKDLVIYTHGCGVTSVVEIEDVTDHWVVENVLLSAAADSLAANGLYASNSWGGNLTQVKCLHQAGATQRDDDPGGDKMRHPNGATGVGIWVHNTIGTGDGGAVNQCVINNCRANYWRIGIALGNDPLSDYVNSNLILGGAVQVCNVGIVVGGGEGNQLLGLHIEQTDVAAVHVGDQANTANLTIQGGKWHLIRGAGVLIDRASNVTVRDIYVTDFCSGSGFIDAQGGVSRVLVEQVRVAAKGGATGSTFFKTDTSLYTSDELVIGCCNRISSSIAIANRTGAMHYQQPRSAAILTNVTGTNAILDATLRDVVDLNPGVTTNVLTISNGYPGQRLILLGGTGPVTITKATGANGGNVRTYNGSDYLMTGDRATEFVCHTDGYWYQPSPKIS